MSYISSASRRQLSKANRTQHGTSLKNGKNGGGGSSKVLIAFVILAIAGVTSVVLKSREAAFLMWQQDTLVHIVPTETQTAEGLATGHGHKTEAPFEALGRRVSEALGKRSFGPAFCAKESIQTRKSVGADIYSTHYRATRFELSPDRPLWSSLDDFTFRPFDAGSKNLKTTKVEWTDVWDAGKNSETTTPPTSGCVDTLVCHVDRTYKNINSWQHTMHFLFPCWSLFRQLPDAKTKIIDLSATKDAKGEMDWQGWTLAVNEVFAREGITFAVLPANAAKNHEEGGGDHSDNDNDGCGNWMANTKLNYDGYGFQQPHGNTPYMNAYYFMNPDDLYALQSSVLGAEFRYGPSMMVEAEKKADAETKAAAGNSNSTAPALDRRNFKVSILNREGSAIRDWKYGKEAYEMIEAEWGNGSDRSSDLSTSPPIDVEYIASYDGYTLEDQAAHMHSADVIITPHGAQLTNAVFIRPCTVVLELLPNNFYHPKKLPLVMEAGGVAFYGYRHGGSPISETPAHRDTPPLESGVGSRLDCTDPDDPKKRKCSKGKWNDVRSVRHMTASPESIAFAIPNLIEAGISCRRQWAATH